VAESLARTADLLRADGDLLDRLAEAELARLPGREELPCAWLAGLPESLRNRVLRFWLLELGAREVPRNRLRAVEELVTAWRGQSWIELPGLRVARREGRLAVHGSRPGAGQGRPR
jgi:tRNA(Ile)-lysidine synthase